MANTTHRATQENGPSVVGGQLIWTSATGITSADPHSYGGCPRRWWYEKVGGKDTETTEAMRGGTALHTEIENKLKHGTSLQSPLALAGGMFIPHAGPLLHIEKPIHFKTRDGVDIFGHVDLYNLRQEYIDENGVLAQDPPWSMEVKDWKTTSSFEYAKSKQQLAENIQLNLYAEAGFRMWPDLEHARLTHVYFRTKGRPESKLVTIRRSREEIGSRWEYAESVVRYMKDIAKAPSAEHVPSNTKSCTAYRGCPHRAYCTAFGSTSLDNLYSKIADDIVQENTPVGIIQNNPQLMNQDMRQQLAQEEQQMRAQQAQQQAQMPQAMPTVADIAAACQRIMSHGRGFPSIGGNASQPYSLTLGNLSQPVQPGYWFQGQGQLAGVQLTEVAHIMQFANDLDAQRAAAQVPQPVPYQQAPTPVGQMQNFTQQVAQAYVQNVGPQAAAAQMAPNFLPPGAPESMPQLAQQYTGAPPVPEAQHPAGPPAGQLNTPPTPEAPAGEKKGRGRPKKDKDTTPEATATVAAPTPPPPVAAPATQAPPAPVSPSGTVETEAGWGSVLVNARFANKATKSLAGYVDYINEQLSRAYCVDDRGQPTIQDVRAAPKESGIAFSAWKGAVKALVRKDPPPQGDYHLDTFMDDLNECVADALRVVAGERGWIYVRGVR